MKSDSGTLGICITFAVIIVMAMFEVCSLKDEIRSLRQEAVDTGHAEWVVEGGKVKGIKFK